MAIGIQPTQSLYKSEFSVSPQHMVYTVYVDIVLSNASPMSWEYNSVFRDKHYWVLKAVLPAIFCIRGILRAWILRRFTASDSFSRAYFRGRLPIFEIAILVCVQRIWCTVCMEARVNGLRVTPN